MVSWLAEFDLSFFQQINPLALFDRLWPYLLMGLGFSLIVFVHELGHFAVAKWAGVRVEKFAIGFGKELFGFTRGETRYSFNALPLGGYVKMLGQEDFDDKSEELKFKDDPRSFIHKPVGHRAAIVSAGVIMNVLFACLLFGIVFGIGREAQNTRIGYVEPDGPADKAGLLVGDDVLKINGERILEFSDVMAAILLAKPHEPIEFLVQRRGETNKSIYIKPDYRRPDSTRDIRRHVVGISPGATREIVALAPGIDPTQPDQPRIGDLLVEIDGVEVTDANASQMVDRQAFASGEAIVERKDPDHPEAPSRRVRVTIPPRMSLYPSDPGNNDTISLLGLTPLVRFDRVQPGGRAELAGLRAGDTVLSWDDRAYPSRADIARSIQDNAERDVYFRVQRAEGRVVNGFVRPKRHKHGTSTIQAVIESVNEDTEATGGAKARFIHVRPNGITDRAGIQSGDVILSIEDNANPTANAALSILRENAGKGGVAVRVRKPDGRILQTYVRPQPPGVIDASYDQAAEDTLRTGRVVAAIHGLPSPAAAAGVPDGVRITAVAGEKVGRWRELVETFRIHAGQTVDLAYAHANGQEVVVPFCVPRCLRTLLGVGPEVRILRIDGREIATITTKGGREDVYVAHHEGMRAILTELAGRTQVAVEYRENAMGEIKTQHVNVTADMVDPWLGRVGFAPNVGVGIERKLLKGENAFDAVWIGLHKTYYFIRQVIESLNRMIVSRSVGTDALSGPLGILDAGGKIARSGTVDFLFFLAILSANLAVINFLPLPIVDGGLMVFLIIEKIKGSPISVRVQVVTQAIGLFLIIGMFLYVTYNDVVRLFG